MFKIARGYGVLEKGVPYLIMAVTPWKDKTIELEIFILIVEQNEVSGIVFVPIKTRISSRLGTLPKDFQLDLTKLLEEEFLLAKQHYCNWLYEQIGDRAFAQVRQMSWQEDIAIIPFALMYYKLSKESRTKIIQAVDQSFSDDLIEFIKTVENLSGIFQRV